jgi:zinc protease
MMRACTIALTMALATIAARAGVAAPAGGEGLKIKIVEWKLPNGLRVLYSPHRRVPAVTVQVWYHVGSKNEHPGIRGIAHMFEHMMFKGSKRVPPEKHARMISAVGGSTNAFTAEDVTAYHNTLPKQYLEFAMQLEAERMRNLRLTLHTIKSERQVVMEEKRVRLENNPIGRALEAIRAMAYTKHPYAWTPAGHMEDLKRMNRADYARFYDTYYKPNNATLIVVGDVAEDRVRAAAAKYFGGIASGPAPPRVTIKEPPQTKLRQRRADWPTQLKVVLGTYHVPAARHPDMAALKVLSAILSAGQSSRLNQALVRKGKLAVAAGGFVHPQEDPGLMMLYGVGLPTHDAEKIRDALLAQVARVVRGGVTAKELAKAKNQLATAALVKIQTLGGLAYQLGRSALLVGDPRAFLTEVPRLDRVTAADVKRVAARYLRTENLSLILMDRTGAPRAEKGGSR